MNAPVAMAGSVFAEYLLRGPIVWLADLAPAHDAAWTARHDAWLTPDERARAGRIQRPERRAQLVAGHVLLRRLAAAVSGVPADAVRVGAEAEGRPIVAWPSGWRASLAHSGRWIAALLDAGDVDAGVDIERHAPRRDIRALVQAACGVSAASDDEAYLTWAQREAEIKAGAAAPSTWVATWTGHALAVCARAAPVVFQTDLGSDRPPVAVSIDWQRRGRLPAQALPQ